MLVWITGLAGAGKTTIAEKVYKLVKKKHLNTILLDGDVLRAVLGGGLGYSSEDRLTSAYRIVNLCKLLNDEDMIVICATMSLFNEIQNFNRKNIPKYLEVYIKVEMNELFSRDKKELYSRAKLGKEDNVVGVNLKYEEPINPELILNNDKHNKIEENVDKIVERIYSLV